jgi:hypothetical protein
MLGDPARLGAEAATLAALCAEIGGQIWRLGPFHYAFRARPEDLCGRLAAIDPADWAGAIETRLGEALGAAGAVRIGAAARGAGEGASLPEAPLLLLRAQGAAVDAGLAAADPGTRAVVHARFAVEAARLAAGLLAGDASEDGPGSGLARRLAMIETRQEEMLEMLVERAEEAATLGRLAAMLSAALDRLDAQGATLAGLAAETGLLAGRVAALAAATEAATEAATGAATGAAPDPAAIAGAVAAEAGRSMTAVAAEAAAFRRELGLALAEFLARLEEEAARPGVPVPLEAALAPRIG